MAALEHVRVDLDAETDDAVDELEYARLRAWASAWRMLHAAERADRQRARKRRRQIAVRAVVTVLILALVYLAFVRFGADPMASVQR